MHRHHRLLVLFIVAFLLLPRLSTAQTMSGFMFADIAPRALGVGGAISRSFGRLQLGGFVDAYMPYGAPAATEVEAFALLHVSASIFVARLHLGVGSNAEGNWTPRGFLILTTATRVAPWINVFVSIPPDNASATYFQTRLGVRVGLSPHWLAIAYVEVPLLPSAQPPFADGQNHLGATLIYNL